MDKASYFKSRSLPHLYVDVDDTLVAWSSHLLDSKVYEKISIPFDHFIEEAVINTHNVEHLKKMARRGHVVIVWSAGGVDWANAVVKALELGTYVDAVLEKPTYYLDDVEDPRNWMGKYSYFTVDGKLIRRQKSCVQLTNEGSEE